MKPGRKPYGTFPGEAEILRFVRERRAAHDTWRRIAELLNQGGLRKRNGRPWTAATLFAISTGVDHIARPASPIAAQRNPIKEDNEA